MPRKPVYFYKEVQPKGNVVQKFVDEAGKEIVVLRMLQNLARMKLINWNTRTTIHFEDNDYIPS